MTVCIGLMAIIDNMPCVIGVTDRMLTSGAVEFEPARQKMVALSNSIFVLTAGDPSIQDEVCQRSIRDISVMIEQNPSDWVEFASAAKIYAKHHDQLRAEHASQAVLAPLGLTQEEFLSRQQELAPSLVKAIAQDLTDFAFASTDSVVLGRDETGAHLYRVQNGVLSCHDSIGFVAVGSGGWHARAQLMFAGHTRYADFESALLLGILAKKRAEVAPGVGMATDVLVVGPNLGQETYIEPRIIQAVVKICDDLAKEERAALQTARTAMADMITQIIHQDGGDQTADNEPPSAE